MNEESLFDKIIGELRNKIEQSDNFQQPLIDQVISLLEQPKFRPEDMTKLIESSAKQDSNQ